MRKRRVLVVADYYLPGFRAGGPVRAISNTVTRLASGIDFFVVTRDHDADGSKYHDVEAGRWTAVAAGCVLYAPRLTPALLRRCVADTACDVIWLNSFFSRASISVLVYRQMGWIRRPVLLAPRGEFSPGALALKRRRKALALWLLRRTGCLGAVHWLASSDAERHDIGQRVGPVPITCVPESVAEVAAGEQPWPTKSRRRLKAVFAARIAPTKNLIFLLEVLARCEGDIHLDIIGPLEDPDYWGSCRALMGRLPASVTAEYVGETTHHDLQRRLSSYDVLILPTLGENFGHIIVEAWAAGCPVLLSDRTPWRQLTSSGLGWDVPLDHRDWTAAIDECVAMSPEAHLVMRRRVREQARHVWREGIAGAASLHQLIERVVPRRESDTGSDLVHGLAAGATDIDPCA